MKIFFYKISSFLMALLVLFSTVSFTVESHYCGNVLVDYSLFNEAESCDMDMDQSMHVHQTKPSKDTFTEKKCCHDQIIIKTGQDNLNISIDNLSIDQQIFVVSYVYTYLNQFEGLKYKVPSFSGYPPPFIVKNIYKLDETYLI
ncbi:HYC_CC_PP family protein [Mariniflexile sp.]|uniref:HYC_CC_PP family protein n=1 Tax=Mariniflexile sp. TaxID=1979402 RepID=UPI004047B73D